MSIIAGLAPAKINLSLRVVSRRPDGFHDIDSTIAFLDWSDSLLLSPARPGTQELHITGRTASIPADATNLVLRAAVALSDFTGRDLPFSAVLDKRIPPGAGLGGGSSDAATTLLGLCELHGLDITPQDLQQVAATVGSDVPMFTACSYGTCRITGRGEIVRPLAWRPAGFCVLLMPRIHVPTPAVYAAWDQKPTATPEDAADWSGDAASTQSWLGRCFNDLQPAAFSLFPELEQIAGQAQDICRRAVIMTGSGSAMFTAFDDANQAKQIAEQISRDVGVLALVVPFRSRAGNRLPEVQHADH